MFLRVAAILLLLLVVNSAYLAAFASPTVFYMANVLAHVLLGAGLLVAGVWLSVSSRSRGVLEALSGVPILLGGITGLALAWVGNTSDHRWLLGSHIALSVVGLLAIAPRLWRWAGPRGYREALVGSLALLALLPACTAAYAKLYPNARDRIVNPLAVPVSMEEEGGGPASPFWPSASRTNTGQPVPPDFFLDSKQCGECHQDIYRQWEASVHHFASFNNQFYRKSIEYMQEVQGSTKASQWCAACHDHAVLFSGKWATPIKDQIDTPEAQAGLGCTSCHAISHVDSSMGNAGFTMEYNDLHELAASRNPVIKALDRFLTYADPEPHRRTFLKPFMRQDSAEFCSTCHKVHLDVPVNQYRWMRGFNDYDNWQASGVSGQGARSFYYPPKSSTCSDCHMPLVASKDPGNRNGMVHSHRFPGANTAVPHVNGDAEQLAVVEGFLKSGFVTVDLFAATPVEETGLEMRRRTADGPQLMSTFAVGEEAESQEQVFLREVGKVAAPLDKTGTRFAPGSTVRVDAVVRTRKVGHFFPGGTVDAFDVWLELQGRDATGRLVHWSGQVEDGGKGPVEKGAHFYRSYQLDGEGNPISRRNAWQTRSLLYVRLIPPGAADVAHYRVRIPKDAVGPITLTAKLNYRKFAHAYTQFSYAGEPVEGQDASLVSASHDSRAFSYDPKNIPANVSGRIKGTIPDLPIVVLAEARTELALTSQAAEAAWTPVVQPADRERWNDWGIGLLLQGDLKGAEYAFEQVIKADPSYPDGYLNVARALIQEGETERAKSYVEKALELGPKNGRNHYFLALVQKADGDYDAALASLRTVESMYPRDRVVLNQIGRLLFLKRQYREAVEVLQRVVRVDPEDVQAHYTLMLAYRGLGQADLAAREQTLFQRFKSDESSQAITGRARLADAEANNERQTIHDHESVRLEAPKEAQGARRRSPRLEALRHGFRTRSDRSHLAAR